jgi:hypothetical protein
MRLTCHVPIRGWPEMNCHRRRTGNRPAVVLQVLISKGYLKASEGVERFA